MGRDQDQSQLTDHLNQQQDEGPNSGGIPDAESPDEILEWLKNTGDPQQLVPILPDLIDLANSSSSKRWSAGTTITKILEQVPPPIHAPDIIKILDSPTVKIKPVIEHLRALYPIDEPPQDFEIDFERIENQDEIGHAQRMEEYHTVSRLPPNETVYQKLREVSDLFDGKVTVGSTTFPLAKFYRSYASRCLLTRLRYPETTPRITAEKTITYFPWMSLRIVATRPRDAIRAGMMNDLETRLENSSPPPNFVHGNIGIRLIQGYLDLDSVEREQFGSLIVTAINAGLRLNRWNEILPELNTLLTDDSPLLVTGEIMGASLSQFADRGVSEWSIEDILDAPELVDSAATGEEAVYYPLRVVARRRPHVLIDHVQTFVDIIQSTDSPHKRESVSQILGFIAAQEGAAVSQHIDPLVEQLPSVKSAEELEDIGRILRRLEVYPPPEQIKSLYGSTDQQIDSNAKALWRDLRRTFADAPSPVTIDEIDSLQTLSQNYELVYQTGPVTWEPFSSSSVDQELVLEAARLVANIESKKTDAGANGLYEFINSISGVGNVSSDGELESVSFVTPSVDPGWIILPVVGAVLGLVINPAAKVALYSPGTNGWGTKKSIKKHLRQFGLRPNNSKSATVVPLLDLVPTARNSGNSLDVESGTTTVSSDPPWILLARHREALDNITVDVVFHNYLGGISGNDALGVLARQTADLDDSNSGNLDALRDPEESEKSPEASLRSLTSKHMRDSDVSEVPSFESDSHHVEFYGVFSMQQAGGRRQYIGPPTDIPAPRIFALSEPGSGSSQLDSTTTPDEHYSSGERAYAYSQLLSGNSSVDLHRVQASTEIGKMLNRLDEYADNLGNSDFESAVRRFRYTISSLPVPVDLHDTWIKKQVDAGNRWVPRRLSHRRNEIKGMADEATLDAQILEDAITTVDTILSELEGNNPLIDHLLSILDDAAKDDLQVGILVRKKTYKDMLKHYLEENASEWALGDNLLLFDEDTIRNTSHREIDWLVTFGTLPPQSAIYYHHPATETTHVIGFADGELYSRLRGVEAKRRPFLPPTTNVDLPGIDVEKHGATIDSESTEWSFTDDLYRTFLSVASKSGQHSESGRGVGQTPTSYRVGFSDGTELTLSDVHPIVVRSEEYLVSTGEYVLKSLEWVSRGDEIVVMEPDTRERLWESFLKERWDESGSEDGEDYDEAFMDAVRLWYSAVETGLEAQDTPDDSMYGAETGFANDIVDKVSVGGDAVRDWARSVMSADEASDLVFQRSLRIGPQNPESVKAVAEEFGDNRFQENWEQVYTQIKSIRSIHRKSGHVFWEWVADRADDGSLFDEPGIALKSVESCRETG